MKCYFKTFSLFLTILSQFSIFGAADFGYADRDLQNQTEDQTENSSLARLLDETDIKLNSDNSTAITKVNNKRKLSVNDGSDGEKKSRNENVSLNEINQTKTLETLRANVLLFAGAQNLDIETIKLVLKQGANIHEKINEETVLAKALTVFNLSNPKILSILEYLIDNGANVDEKTRVSNWQKMPPLMIACFWNFFEIANFLILRGANVNLISDEGHTALTSVFRNVTHNLIKDNIGNFANLIERSDLNKILKFRYAIKYTTPLFYATDCYVNCLDFSKEAFEDIIEMMIKNGADIYARDPQGNLFIEKCAPKVKTLLLEKYYEYVEFGNKLTELLRTQNLLPEVLNRLVLSYLNLDGVTCGTSEQIISAESVNNQISSSANE